ncbi:NAD-dependent epimerase/dehydratase family protein [Congregibacter brevis]|uniref:NAD-dependent epimerase/dehydratase family protein n=1 Tax=Congregibacter brevis TaxID=3081201 RepID=A0ABZ0IIX9_9GAMM|nr:NAD-dependent epimerase/dehydratase family protein [Congregibacter sp. IMCC45268]
MHCLVTGANGYIGQALLPALAEREYLLSTQCRPGAVSALQRVNANLLECDFGSDTWELPLQGVDVVVHLAGVAHQHGEANAYQLINVDASLALADRAIAAGVHRFIFVSSVKAEAAEYDQRRVLLPVSEAENPYAQSKAMAEEGLRQRFQGSDVTLVVLRPALVYSEGSLGHLRWLRRWTNLHLPAPPEGGQRSMIALTDLVRLLTLLVELPIEHTQTFVTVTDGESYSTRRLHAALCTAMQRQPWLPSPPAFVWQALGRILDTVRGEAPGRTWDRMTGDECYSSQGLDVLGFSPSLNFESSLGIAADVS